MSGNKEVKPMSNEKLYEQLIKYLEERKLSVIYSDGDWYCFRASDDTMYIDELVIDGHIGGIIGRAGSLIEAIYHYSTQVVQPAQSLYKSFISDVFNYEMRRLKNKIIREKIKDD